MWVGVRAIGGKQVCEKVVDPGAEPTDVPRGEWDKVCVDFASFPALYHAAPEAEKAELGGRAFVAEGVALHFLEDSFSAGHGVATWEARPGRRAPTTCTPRSVSPR